MSDKSINQELLQLTDERRAILVAAIVEAEAIMQDACTEIGHIQTHSARMKCRIFEMLLIAHDAVQSTKMRGFGIPHGHPIGDD